MRLDVSEEEFRMFQRFRFASEDPRVQRMAPKERLPAIARDAGYATAALRDAVARVEAAGDVEGRCEAAIRAALDGSPLAGRAGRIDLDASAEHAVAYVQWFAGDPESLGGEACLAAGLSATSCPVASSLQLWAIDPERPSRRLFEALIGGPAARRLDERHLASMGSARCLRLFEQVRSGGEDADEAAPTKRPAATERPAPTETPTARLELGLVASPGRSGNSGER